MNKYFTRILSLILLISIISQPLSVYASSETFSERMNRYKTRICNACDKVFNDAQILHDSIIDLYDDFVLSIDSTMENAIMALSTDIEIYQYIFNSFCEWIKKNKLFGVQEELNGVPIPDEFKLVIRRSKPQGSVEPSLDFSTPDSVSPDPNIYDIGNYNTNYPYSFGKDNLQYFIYTNSLPNDYTTSIWGAVTDTTTNVNWSANQNFLNYNSKFLSVGKYGLADVYVYMWGFNTQDDNNITIIYASDVSNFYSYWQSNYVKNRNIHIDGDYIYFDGANNGQFQNVRYYRYNNGWHYTNDGGYRSYPMMPFSWNGRNFFNYAQGNFLILAGEHGYLFYNGVWYDVPNEDNISFNNWETLYRVKIANRYPILNISNYNNAVNNYITTYNTVVNDYPQATLNEILDILNNLNFSDSLNEINNRLDQLTYELQEQLNELEGLRLIVTNIKNYCRRIELKLNEFFDKFDSLFLSSGIFFLDTKLDYLYNHLSSEMTSNTNRLVNAINNINVSSNGGGGDINFGDFIVDIDASLNLLFSLNIDQKAELENDINTMKAPFSWIPETISNVGTFYHKLVARSAYWSGTTSTEDFSNSAFDDFFGVEEEVSAADPSEPSTRSSVPGSVGSASDTGGSSFIYPVIYLHFGDSTSSINYGGDVPAIDFSWYAPYKPIVDTIIVSFCWAVFILNIVRLIPSIINGDSNNDKVDSSGGTKK